MSFAWANWAPKQTSIDKIPDLKKEDLFWDLVDL